jgi:hypothetical protein
VFLCGALAGLVIGCVDDSKSPPPLGFHLDAGLTPTPLADAAPPADGPGVDAAVPALDAGPDGASFATGLGAGAVVTKSAKYTLITKTGGSPGGHGVSRTPIHTVVSGAAANAKK